MDVLGYTVTLASLIVFSRKKIALLQIRIYYWNLNIVAVKEAYPLWLSERFWDLLGEPCIFLIIEACFRYQQVEINNTDKEKYTFILLYVLSGSVCKMPQARSKVQWKLNCPRSRGTFGLLHLDKVVFSPSL